MKHHKKVPQARLSQGLRPQKPPPQKNAPLSAAVESDVVGYHEIEMKENTWYQIGTPFVALGNTDEVQTINTVFNSGFSDGDFAYIYSTSKSGYAAALKWSEEKGGWVNALNRLATNEIPTGTAVFIKKGVAGTITVQGRVSSTELSMIPGESWAQVVCVYPTAKTINEMTWTGMAIGDEAYVYDVNRQAYRSALIWKGNSWNNALNRPDTTELSIGQAIFVHKKSQGDGTLRPIASSIK